MKRNIRFVFPLLLGSACSLHAQQTNKLIIQLNKANTHQMIDNFAASDAWACQFVGNWPEEKKNVIADWLFSMDTLPNGNPKGIGLTLWRYNLGAGSAEQGKESGIRDEWRRAALTMDTTSEERRKVQAQNWFLKAASQRGVQQFLGFYNSPPVQFTTNGKAFADSGRCNLGSNRYTAFADYTIHAMKQVEQQTGVAFDYISPVNEPQWDWSDGGQEGCPYNNAEISSLAKAFNRVFKQNNSGTKVLIAEAGQLDYLLPAANHQEKDNQIKDFFDPSSLLYIGNLPHLSNIIASHSYFTTSPVAKAVALRTRVRDSVSHIKNLTFWQSEYCILGDNNGEINGGKKDLGMNAALYLAKVIHTDLTSADASAWQWWTAISAYDYKDGLIYIDKNENDGNYADSKMLWVLGNYSRFLRPGMQRIETGTEPVENLYVSAYQNKQTNDLVCVLINDSEKELTTSVAADNLQNGFAFAYITNAANNLARQSVNNNTVTLPPKSVVTLISR